jgi:transcriptional regulator with XRE-family HTH domain
MCGMNGPAAQKLKELRTRLGLSMSDVAVHLGLPRFRKSSYQHYEDKHKEEHLPLSLVSQLVDLFVSRGADEREVWALAGVEKLFLEKSRDLIVSHANAVRVTVSHIAEAELWRGSKMNDAEETGAFILAPDPEFPDCPRYGLKLQGRVADLAAPDGFVAVCISLSSIGREPRHKEYVHVTRRDLEKGREETTVRQCAIVKGEMHLASCSSRPDLQYSLKPGMDEHGDEVVISGVVRLFYQDVRA